MLYFADTLALLGACGVRCLVSLCVLSVSCCAFKFGRVMPCSFVPGTISHSRRGGDAGHSCSGDVSVTEGSVFPRIVVCCCAVLGGGERD